MPKKERNRDEKSYSIIVNKISRPVLVEKEENKLSFPLKGSERIHTFKDILTIEQKTDSGMTFLIDNYRVTIFLPKGIVKNLTSESTVRGYLTQIGIPVKGHVMHSFYKE
jgi:hypothetical protein